LFVSGSVARTVTTSSGVVSAWKFTVSSASLSCAGPNGARRVISASLVLQKLNSHSPLLSRQLKTPLRRYSTQAPSRTGSRLSGGQRSGKSRRMRFSRSQKAR